MKSGDAFLIGASGLLSGCEPPLAKPALNAADLKAVADSCEVPASAISLHGDEVTFVRQEDMTYARSACLLKEVRERFPAARIGFADRGAEASKEPNP